MFILMFVKLLEKIIELTLMYCRISGLSPFLGDTDSETFSNVTSGQWDFEDDDFDDISDNAKDFIEKLLVINPK